MLILFVSLDICVASITDYGIWYVVSFQCIFVVVVFVSSSLKKKMSLKASFPFLVTLGWLLNQAAGQCIADETINAQFASDGYSTTTTAEDLEAAGTCW
mmetsp:Transcript_32784/g.55871  ORF Transcript_32784/g.55871 Transcript_32784/m.55871 type:complete len:99 (+) Transcript_32784:1430-1726(+)